MPENLNAQWKQLGRPKKIQTYTPVNLDKVAKSTFPFPPLSPLISPTSSSHRTENPYSYPHPLFPPKERLPSLLPSPSLDSIHSVRLPPPTPFSLSLSLSLHLSHPFLTKLPHQKLPSPSIVFVFSGLVRESSGVWVSVLGGGGGGGGAWTWIWAWAGTPMREENCNLPRGICRILVGRFRLYKIRCVFIREGIWWQI